MEIPGSVFDKIKTPPPGVSFMQYMDQVLESSMLRVLNGTKEERFAMMELALPKTQENRQVEPSLDGIDEEIKKRFDEYVSSKGLKADVLMTGALMLELGMANLPAKFPPSSNSFAPSSTSIRCWFDQCDSG